jgi:hypothetical protein
MIVRSELSPAARQHADGCDECGAFRADLLAIQAAADVPAETPSFLRERTLARCAEMLRQKATVGELTPWQRWRRALYSPRFVAAAAVVGVAVLVTVMALQINDAQDDATNLSLKLTIFQVLAQNVYAALFLPALLFFRGRLAATTPRAIQTGE